jgi:hypothetical protein
MRFADRCTNPPVIESYFYPLVKCHIRYLSITYGTPFTLAVMYLSYTRYTQAVCQARRSSMHTVCMEKVGTQASRLFACRCSRLRLPFEMCGIRACRLMFLFRPGFASRLFTGVQGEVYSK